ncbi:MAG: putative peptidoglycan glycosyltransferase FtsW [Rickettsiales bacterium]
MKWYLWWKSIDKTILYITYALILIGVLLVNVSTQSVALRIGINYYNFINKQLFFLISGSFLIILISMLKQKVIEKLSIFNLLVFFILLILVNFIGAEVKGAKRWLNILGISLQPSEFIKPFFCIVNAIILSNKKISFKLFNLDINYEINEKYTLLISFLLYIIIGIFLLIQPDFGMFLVFSFIWFMQIFIAGLSYYIVGIFSIMVFGAAIFAYTFFGHVKNRIDLFLSSSSANFETNYQVTKSLLAFKNGGFFGVGLGDGVIKRSLPDSHTDFIFAVAAEEFGGIFCIIILTLFTFLIIRVLLLCVKNNDKFTVFASIGLVAQIIFQAFTNIGVSLNLLPTKGMTLPLISYGGSSTLAICILFGLLLNLNKNIVTHNYKYKF